MLTIEGPNYTYPSDINELRGATRRLHPLGRGRAAGAFHERVLKAPCQRDPRRTRSRRRTPQLRTFFLSILDRGTTTDNQGRDAELLERASIFFTSNLGIQRRAAAEARRSGTATTRRAGPTRSDRGRAVRTAARLAPEFMNRVRMIHFEPAHADERGAHPRPRAGARSRGATPRSTRSRLVVEPSAREEIIRRGFSPSYGARHLAAVLESACNVEVAQKQIRQDDRAPGDGEVGGRALAAGTELRAGRAVRALRRWRGGLAEFARARLDYDTP